MKTSLIRFKLTFLFIFFSLVLISSSHYSEEEISQTISNYLWKCSEDNEFINCLHSHKLQWGTGSHQQSVTSVSNTDDTNSLWLVKEANEAIPIPSGTPVKCGEKIRLEHVNTQRNLHSHDYRSWITESQEVSCLGENGQGDVNDNWEIQCEQNENYLHGNSAFYLFHVGTRHYLYINLKKSLFNDFNCSNCPIRGQREVSAQRTKDAQSRWRILGGLIINAKENTNDDSSEKRDL